MSGFDDQLAELALMCERMKDLCDEIIDIIDTVDQRLAVTSWNAGLSQQLDAIARIEQEMHR